MDKTWRWEMGLWDAVAAPLPLPHCFQGERREPGIVCAACVCLERARAVPSTSHPSKTNS